jgi:hypothetical protein
MALVKVSCPTTEQLTIGLSEKAAYKSERLFYYRKFSSYLPQVSPLVLISMSQLSGNSHQLFYLKWCACAIATVVQLMVKDFHQAGHTFLVLVVASTLVN